MRQSIMNLFFSASYVLRIMVIFMGLVLLWWAVVKIANVPFYMLPGPDRVFLAAAQNFDLLLMHTGVTVLEMVLGLVIGVTSGTILAFLLVIHPPSQNWILPVLVISQALPVFAIAPLLVLWLGYGLASKVAMATLIIFFPVTVTIHDGLKHIPTAWLDQAQLMTQANSSGTKTTYLFTRIIHNSTQTWRRARHLLIPAALPTIASGLRVAAAVVPIGAVVGEWVGSSAGLGHLMLVSNARVQTDIMFAALFFLAIIGLALYYSVDLIMRHLTRNHTL